MMRVVALVLLAAAGAAISFSQPILAKGGMRGGGGGMPGYRGFAVTPRVHFRPSPRAFGTIRPSTPFGTVRPSTPFGTVKPSAPFGTVRAITPHGTVRHAPAFGTLAAPAHKPRFARRHHGAYYAGWNFPITYAGDEPVYIGVPYDPSEAIPVYGPAVTEVDPQQEAARVSNVRPANGDGCSSERVTVPSAEGEREIKVVRCSQ